MIVTKSLILDKLAILESKIKSSVLTEDKLSQIYRLISDIEDHVEGEFALH